VSSGGAKIGELRVLDISVGGVEERATWEAVVKLGEDSVLVNGPDAIADCGFGTVEFMSQFAQKCNTGVVPLGERIRGIVQPGVEHELSVRTQPLSMY